MVDEDSPVEWSEEEPTRPMNLQARTAILTSNFARCRPSDQQWLERMAEMMANAFPQS